MNVEKLKNLLNANELKGSNNLFQVDGEKATSSLNDIAKIV